MHGPLVSLSPLDNTIISPIETFPVITWSIMDILGRASFHFEAPCTDITYKTDFILTRIVYTARRHGIAQHKRKHKHYYFFLPGTVRIFGQMGTFVAWRNLLHPLV